MVAASPGIFSNRNPGINTNGIMLLLLFFILCVKDLELFLFSFALPYACFGRGKGKFSNAFSSNFKFH